jgi:uncharacterized SAM-binding protein YcdF (DUF218 family)
MYFVFSKLLLPVILPINWIVVLFLVSLFTKNKKVKTRTQIASFALLVIFTNPLLLNFFAHRWDYPAGKLQAGSYNCTIVLGGFSGVDSQENLFFNQASDRFIQGLKLLETGKSKQLLISGGSGNLFDQKHFEAVYVAKELRLFNIPESRILVESRSKNTLENAQFSKKILDNAHVAGPYLLVTSAFHMRRSMYLFKKAGLNVVAYPCNYFAGNENFKFDEFFPNADDLGYWNTYLKEVVGFIVAHFQKVAA